MVDLRQKNWIYGLGKHVTFDGLSNPAQQSTGNSFNTAEGCASISNDLGQLVLYSDGNRVFDANHNVVATNAGGTRSASNGVLILPPISGQISVYHLLTVSDDDTSNPTPDKISHSTYSANASSAAQVLAPLSIFPSGGAGFDFSERMAACYSHDCKAYWLVSQEAATNRFFAFKVTSDGRVGTPVVSQAGLPCSKFSAGCMKFSANGEYLAWADTNQSFVSIEKFDRVSGVFSHYADYTNLRSLFLPVFGARPYGVEFSPDGSLLYITTLTGAIYSVDFSQGSFDQSDLNRIYSSRFLKFGAAQNALNGHMYIQRGQILSEIRDPNNFLVPDFRNVARDDYGSWILDIWGYQNLGLPSFIEKQEEMMNMIHLTLNSSAGGLPRPNRSSWLYPHYDIDALPNNYLKFEAVHIAYKLKSLAVAQVVTSDIDPNTALTVEVRDFEGNLLRTVSQTVAWGNTGTGVWVSPTLSSQQNDLEIQPGEIVVVSVVNSNSPSSGSVVGSLIGETI